MTWPFKRFAPWAREPAPHPLCRPAESPVAFWRGTTYIQPMGELAPRQRGRPKDNAKRDAILDAARSLFLAHGPHAVALDAVADLARVSKSTFYSNFADRGSLLEALIRRESDRIVSDEDLVVVTAETLVPALTAFGLRLLRFLADPEIVGFERLIAAAARDHPDLPGRFFEAGPGRARARLALMITEGARSGALRVEDAVWAAENLVGLWQGMMRVELSMGFRPPPSDDALSARAARGVQSFLAIYENRAAAEP